MSLYNELPIVFPWYEKIEQQDRYRENVNGICAFKLISPKNSLLPFQFRKPKTGAAPTGWIVLRLDDNSTVADISASIPDIVFSSKVEWDYFTFQGTPITDLDLAPGFYFSILIFPDDSVRFSEVFFIPDTSLAFNVEDTEIEFVKIQFYNNGDIAPIFYDQESPDGGSFFKQVVYLDTFITASEPELTVDGTKDGNDELIPTFQKVVINYRITIDAGEYLKKALATMPMHDVVTLTTKQNVRNGDLEKLAVDSALEGNGAISIVDIVFQDVIAMVKKGCDSPIKSACVGDPTRLDSIVDGTPDTDYLFTGYAPPGTSVQLYGSTTLSGPKTLIAGAVTSYSDFVAGVQFAKTLFDDYEFVSAKATSTGCDFGFSVPLDKAPLPTEGLILIFVGSGVPVDDITSLSDWNAFFDTLSNADTFFTDLLIDETANSVTLFGASNLYIKDSLFQGTSSLVRMLDPGGVVKTVGYNAFNTCTTLIEVNLPGCLRINGNGFLNAAALSVINFPLVTFIDIQALAETAITSLIVPLCTQVGPNSLEACPLTSIDLSACTDLGGTTGDDLVFNLISGNTIAFTLKTATATDGDVVYLQANNTVTLTLV